MSTKYWQFELSIQFELKIFSKIYAMDLYECTWICPIFNFDANKSIIFFINVLSLINSLLSIISSKILFISRKHCDGYSGSTIIFIINIINSI